MHPQVSTAEAKVLVGEELADALLEDILEINNIMADPIDISTSNHDVHIHLSGVYSSLHVHMNVEHLGCDSQASFKWHL